jgi:hypothetical protein
MFVMPTPRPSTAAPDASQIIAFRLLKVDLFMFDSFV